MHYFSPRNGERFPDRHRRWDSAHLTVGKPTAKALVSQAAETEEMGKSGLTKTEADDLLDWLEANGYEHYEISSVTDQSFSVRWWH